MLEITIGETGFDFWADTISSLLGVILGGLLTILGGHIQTRKDIEREEKRRRWDVARELSQSMTRLQATVARDATSIVSQKEYTQGELDKLYHNGTQAFEGALICFYGIRFALSDNLAKSTQSFLDATEHNIRVWDERIHNKHCREPLSYLPHTDQGKEGGKACDAFNVLSDKLDNYVKKG